MTDHADRLIATLAADLAPVRRVAHPAWSAFAWAAAVLGFAALLAGLSHGLKLGHVSPADRYVGLEIAASVLTALAAALAAFELSLPDRSDRWAWLPVGPAFCWVAVSGFGCLSNLGTSGVWGSTIWESAECLLIILGTSLPAAILMIAMLRRACPLRTTAVAIMAGLATAGASASLLVLVHPHDSAALDLLAHAVAVTSVVLAHAKWGRRFMRSPTFDAGR